jgi:hypothetical protein
MKVSAAEGVQEDKAARSEATSLEAILGNLDSCHTHTVVDVESDSTQSLSSQSTSSSSSTDFDDVTLGKLYPSTQKGHSTRTNTYKKPSQTIPFELGS